MSPLIRKEIRMLFPYWAMAMFLAVLPSLLVPVQGYWLGLEAFIFQAFSMGLIFLGLAPFGQEFAVGTFSSLLAQPIERRRIWRLKISLAAIAALMVLIGFVLSIHWRLGANAKEAIAELGRTNRLTFTPSYILHWQTEQFRPACGDALLLVAIAFSGGLWATLLFRQIGAALWFVILIPASLYVVVQGVCEAFSVDTSHIIVVAVLVIYSVAGFIWAHHMFACAQDSQWLGETVALLSLTSSKPTADDTTAPRRKGVLRALVRKEFQSHQVSLLVAFGLLVLHSCTLIVRKFVVLPRNSELLFALGAVPFLWLFVPWLIGCVTVAEERKLGTLESQLCLPVTRRFQFATKFAIAMLLGVALGGIMPSLLEWLGTQFHVASQIIVPTRDSFASYVHQNPYDVRTYSEAYQGVVLMCLGALGITFLSVFSSALSRNTLHALGGSILLGFAFVALFAWINNGSSSYNFFLWKGPLIFLIGVPVTGITLAGLSFLNYKRSHVGGDAWFRTLFILCATLVFTGIATAFVNQRPWELITPREPFHGPKRLSGTVRPSVSQRGGKVVALLPDGRIWVATQYRWQPVTQYAQPEVPSEVATNLGVPIPTNGVFVEGSNWVALAANLSGSKFTAVALRSDGTLWNLFSPGNGRDFKRWEELIHQKSELQQIENKLRDQPALLRTCGYWEEMLGETPQLQQMGSDSDWKMVGPDFYAIKTNGTLWRWGRNGEGQMGTNYPAFVTEPVRANPDSDWEAIFTEAYGNPLFMKRNGNIWSLEWEYGNGWKLVPINVNGADWLSVAGNRQYRLIIRRDRSLWAQGFRFGRIFGIKESSETSRIGGDSDWDAVYGSSLDFVAIKGGRLLRNGTTLFANSLGQPSAYSDWIAADYHWTELIALAGDGTLNMWKYSSTDDKFSKVLGPTHHPFWSLNILTSSPN